MGNSETITVQLDQREAALIEAFRTVNIYSSEAGMECHRVLTQLALLWESEDFHGYAAPIFGVVPRPGELPDGMYMGSSIDHLL
jgi:hypothetical protein